MDALGLTLLLSITSLLVCLGVLEGFLHRRQLDSFRFRVQVNGTRGKSSVARLIASGLRAGGIRTCAKTTGTLPRLIHPDGIEEPIYRVGPPNVIEQLGVVRRARYLKAEAIVVECMALQPFLQWISTARLIRPTHGVITNVRADHLEVMGPDVYAVGQALAGSVAPGVPLYTAEQRVLEPLVHAAKDRGAELKVVRAESEEVPVTPEELARFRYIEHAENVALALRVCQELGVPRRKALLGMQASRPDPGALTIEPCRVAGVSLSFVNAFAANDPESTGQVWELALERSDPEVRRVALFNCRLDRPERSTQLAEAVGEWSAADHYVVAGTGTHFFVHALEATSFEMSRVEVLEGIGAEALARRLAVLGGSGGVVVGLGNIGGVGLELLEAVRDGDIT